MAALRPVGLSCHGERDLTFQDVASLGTRMIAPPCGHIRDKLNKSNHGLEMGPRHIKGLRGRSLPHWSLPQANPFSAYAFVKLGNKDGLRKIRRAHLPTGVAFLSPAL
jgi:hypothetical protein